MMETRRILADSVAYRVIRRSPVIPMEIHFLDPQLTELLNDVWYLFYHLIVPVIWLLRYYFSII